MIYLNLLILIMTLKRNRVFQSGGDTILKSNLSKFSKNLKIGHFNACSINPRRNKGKIDEIRNILKNGLLNAVAVSETWLKSYISNKAVSIKGYKIIRNDRPIRWCNVLCL